MDKKQLINRHAFLLRVIEHDKRDSNPKLSSVDYRFIDNEIKEIEKALKSSNVSIKLKRSAFKYLIPSKRREEVIGDLIETNIAMEKEGFPKWKIALIMYFNMATVLIGLWRTRLNDFGRTKAKKDIVDQ